jgi:hypothetical protein
MVAAVERVDAIALVGALVAHAALLGLARVAPEPAAEGRPLEIDPLEVEIERDLTDRVEKEVVVVPPPPAPPTDAPPSDAPQRLAAATPPAGRLAAAAPIVTAEGGGQEGSEPIVAPPSPSSAPTTSDGGWTQPRPGNTGVPGLGGAAPVWAYGTGVLPALPAPVAAPTAIAVAPIDREAATRVLTAAMKERDKKLGIDLPAAGSVASAVADVVRSVSTINEGKATLVVRLGPGGKVTGVSVSSMTAGSSGDWDRVASAVSSKLASKQLFLTTEYEKGAVVTVTVTSKMQLPAGGKSVISQQGLGASYDLSSIGAHPTRVVSTSFSVKAVK